MISTNDFDIEYVLLILAHPELEETDTFKSWIQKPEHMELYLDAKAVYDGLALKEKSLPDPQNEWEILRKRLVIAPVQEVPEQKKSHKSVLFQKSKRLQRWSVAASFFIAIMGAGMIGYWLNSSNEDVLLSDPVTLMTTQTSQQEVILAAGSGHQLVLSAQSDRDSLAALGTSMDKEQKLAYQQDIKQEESVIHTLSTPRGKDFKLVLSDGTEVWLNAESMLRYPSRFVGEKRVVELTGEAFFHVAKDTKHPFIVKTDGMETQVLGTSFNFRNYAHNTPHVTLVEGKVLVTGNQTSVCLNPGEDVQMQKDGTMQVQQVDTRNYTAWTNGYFYFDNASLADIMSELGRWYNLTILFNNPQAMDYHFNVWAKRKDRIEDVLALINGLGKVEISINGNVLTIH